MKAIVLHHKGTLPQYKEVSLPNLQEGQIEAVVLASSLNHRDLWITKGKYPGIREGVILGSDGCVTYDDSLWVINPGLNWGDKQAVQSNKFEVLGMPSHGTFAERIQTSANSLYPIPKHLDELEAAALPLAGLTAYRALFTRAKAKPKDKILIHGVGGGVASMALQMALAISDHVYVTSGNHIKITKAKELGAQDGVNYNNPKAIKSLAKDIGYFDLIVDSAGGSAFSDLVYATAPGGRIVVYGGTKGTVDGISPQILFWRQISILGSTMGSPHDFEEMLLFVEKHKIYPIIDNVFSLSSYQAAFDRMERSEQFGKIVFRHE